MSAALRPDLAAIAEMIPQGARVLDVGCGDGALLEHLAATKNVDGRGLELS
ncbi:MAG: methionine biosynthesis protein MetW, partial [Rhizomicrobium sp.]